MSILRPGEFRITDRAMELCAFQKGAAILDIGCGEGDVIQHLEEKYGYTMSGIDLNLEMVRKAKELNPNAAIKYGDGEFLEDFFSFSFDCVLLECVLSMVNMPDEALHEAYCVLKKGGKLCISDMYIKDPEPELLVALDIEAKRQQSTPHKEGSCDDCAEDHENRAVNFRLAGRFVEEPLKKQLIEIGYTNLHWEDCSVELDNFVAQTLMDCGSLDGCCIAKDFDPKDKHKTGYFLLVAEKPL